jgi:hypothetical protein
MIHCSHLVAGLPAKAAVPTLPYPMILYRAQAVVMDRWTSAVAHLSVVPLQDVLTPRRMGL